MFLFKKMVGPLFLPLPLCFLVIGLGLVLLWFTRRQKTGKVVITFGYVLLVVLSYGWLVAPPLQSLEHTFRPPDDAALAPVKWVVVLGGGSNGDSDLPVTSRANGVTLSRLVEGIRLQRQIPGARLLVSGGAAFHAGSDAEAMAGIAMALGVSRASIVLEAESLDTESQAVNIGRIVKDEPFVMVTSAYHMPRAMALFAKAGLHPVAGPANFITARRPVRGAIWATPDLYPSIGGLLNTQIVQNEYLGMAWATMRGKI